MGGPSPAIPYRVVPVDRQHASVGQGHDAEGPDLWGCPFFLATLVKNAKMVPVMVGAIVLVGTRYPARKWAQVALIVEASCWSRWAVPENQEAGHVQTDGLPRSPWSTPMRVQGSRRWDGPRTRLTGPVAMGEGDSPVDVRHHGRPADGLQEGVQEDAGQRVGAVRLDVIHERSDARRRPGHGFGPGPVLRGASPSSWTTPIY